MASDPEQVAESLRPFILVVVIVAGVQTNGRHKGANVCNALNRELPACPKHLVFGDCFLLTGTSPITGFVCCENKMLEVRTLLSL